MDTPERDASTHDAAPLDAGALDARSEDPRDARVETDAAADSASFATDAGSRDAAAALDAAATIASALEGLTLVAPCTADTPLPLAKGATCQHDGALRLTKKVTLGGDPARVYQLHLRIRGIWEPTSITGGMHPDAKLPLTIGGTVTQGAGDPINYQQWFVQVAKPAQIYWLNDYRYVAHDIHREDYQATLRANGGSELSIVMNDGNDHQIANWTRDVLSDGGMPATGQVLHIDVVSVE